MEKLPVEQYLAMPDYEMEGIACPLIVSYSGSMAHGMNHANSDADMQGIYMGDPEKLACQKDDKSWRSQKVDLTMYTLHYAMQLMARCNPTVLEILFTRPEDRYCYNNLGRKLVNHRNLFLSQKAVGAYVGYCKQQLGKLKNAIARDRSTETETEQHLQETLDRMKNKMAERYRGFTDEEIRFYVGESTKSTRDTELFVDLHLTHYPMRDLKSSIADFQDMLQTFDSGNMGARNHKKDDLHLCKHATHMIRLLAECRDLLSSGSFCPCMPKEIPTLWEIRNGKFLRDDGTWDMDGFSELLHKYEEEVSYAEKHSVLPMEPDYDKLMELEAEMVFQYLRQAP